MGKRCVSTQPASAGPPNLRLASGSGAGSVHDTERNEPGPVSPVHDQRRRRSSATRAVAKNRRMKRRAVRNRAENRPDRRVGIGAGDASSRFSPRIRKKQNAALAVARDVVASSHRSIYDSFVVTVYRHNSLNSEGGACFQVTISRHLRRTRRGEKNEFRSEKEELGPGPIHGGAPNIEGLLATKTAARR